jgi:cyclic-di-AMP phosphodiesterase PgpH
MANNEDHAQGQFSDRIGWKTSRWIRISLYLSLAILIYFSLIHRLIPQRFDIQVGAVSTKTINAPSQTVNEKDTEIAKEEAVKKVEPIYQIVNFHNENTVESLFYRVDQINADTEVKVEDKVSIFRSVLPSIIRDANDAVIRSSGFNTNPALIDEINKKLDAQQYKIAEESFFKFPRITKEDIAAMTPVAKEIVAKIMNDQITDAQTARTKITELVNSSQLTKNTMRELVQEAARAVITPNKFFDAQATEIAKTQARESVKPIYINKGDLLIAKGERVTADKYQMLLDLGLLKGNMNYWPYVGLIILVGLLVLFLFYYIRQNQLPIALNNSQLLMFVLIVAINVAGMKIIALGQNLGYPYIIYIAPVAVGSMLIAILLQASMALLSAVIFSILASVIFNLDHTQLFDFRYGLLFLFVSIASVFAINKASQRSSILKAGAVVSLVSLITISAFFMIDNFGSTKLTALSLLFGGASGLLTAMLVIGLLPFFEVAFRILSPLKLVELSNPNHPLLRKLLTETPGTYHHSIMVANLAETAAEAVRADGLLCRVGAYYHDIGKTKRPSYFIENQTNMENPHDRIDPALSKSIIIAHARDGVEILKESNMPKQICDIAQQHHGTTLLQYFYHKAASSSEQVGTVLNEEDYRYDGPKAQTKEAAIVGIADCVEAAVRSMRNPTMEQIDTMVRKIIKSRLDDGQFNECDLTLKDLDHIAKALNETLLGIFHSRIEYPGETKVEV